MLCTGEMKKQQQENSQVCEGEIVEEVAVSEIEVKEE